MASPISNIVTPAQQALNGAMYGKPNPAVAGSLSFSGGALQNSNPAAPLGPGMTAENATIANSLLGPLASKPSTTTTGAASGVVNSGIGSGTTPTGGGVTSTIVNPSIGGATLNGQPVSGAPGGPINGGNITQANTQPNLPVTPQNPAAQVFNPQTGTWGASTPQAPYSAATTGLLGAPAQNTQLGQNATDITNSYNKQIAALAPLTSAAGDLSTGTSAVGGGNATLDSSAISQRIGVLEGQEAQQLAGNSQGITAQGQAQSALNSAGQLTQPQLGSIGGQQYYNPVTAGSSGSGTLPQAAQDAVNLQIQKVKSGNSTVADAQSALSAYGQAGLNALQAGLGSGFSNVQSNANAASQATNLSNTSSQAQATQQAVTYANQVLDDLTAAYNAQGSLQKTGIPLVNAGANLLSQLTGFGISNTQGYSSTQGEALAAVSQALSSGGITPTSAGQIAQSLIPSNATPAQIQTAKTYLQTFLSQRQSTYTTPPAAATYGGSQSNSMAGQGSNSTSLPVPVEQMNY